MTFSLPIPDNLVTRGHHRSVSFWERDVGLLRRAFRYCAQRFHSTSEKREVKDRFAPVARLLVLFLAPLACVSARSVDTWFGHDMHRLVSSHFREVIDGVVGHPDSVRWADRSNSTVSSGVVVNHAAIAASLAETPDRQKNVSRQHSARARSGRSQLKSRVQKTTSPTVVILVTAKGDQRLLAVDRKYRIVWQYEDPEATAFAMEPGAPAGCHMETLY